MSEITKEQRQGVIQGLNNIIEVYGVTIGSCLAGVVKEAIALIESDGPAEPCPGFHLEEHRDVMQNMDLRFCNRPAPSPGEEESGKDVTQFVHPDGEIDWAKSAPLPAEVESADKLRSEK